MYKAFVAVVSALIAEMKNLSESKRFMVECELKDLCKTQSDEGIQLSDLSSWENPSDEVREEAAKTATAKLILKALEEREAGMIGAARKAVHHITNGHVYTLEQLGRILAALNKEGVNLDAVTGEAGRFGAKDRAEFSRMIEMRRARRKDNDNDVDEDYLVAPRGYTTVSGERGNEIDIVAQAEDGNLAVEVTECIDGGVTFKLGETTVRVAAYRVPELDLRKYWVSKTIGAVGSWHSAKAKGLTWAEYVAAYEKYYTGKTHKIHIRPVKGIAHVQEQLAYANPENKAKFIHTRFNKEYSLLARQMKMGSMANFHGTVKLCRNLNEAIRFEQAWKKLLDQAAVRTPNWRKLTHSTESTRYQLWVEWTTKSTMVGWVTEETELPCVPAAGADLIAECSFGRKKDGSQAARLDFKVKSVLGIVPNEPMLKPIPKPRREKPITDYQQAALEYEFQRECEELVLS